MDIPYIATAEDIDLKDRDGKPTARFFTISYTAEGVGGLWHLARSISALPPLLAAGYKCA